MSNASENDKENLNTQNVQKEEPEEAQKKNDVSDYSSRNKSNIFSKDESSSFLGMSDDMITIEDTYKETEAKEANKTDQKSTVLPNTYLINHIEMNVIEEQADEEDKSCNSSVRVSNNFSAYNSNDPYYVNSNKSREQRKKQRDSFETFGQKSLAGAMYTIKSDSKNSKNADTSLDSQKAFESLDVNKLAPPFGTSVENNEEEKSQYTEDIMKKNLDTDDSTDISAQITKRTNNAKSSGQKGEGHQSSFSMPVLNLDSISKQPIEATFTKESLNSHNSEILKTSVQGNF